jgi:hypothetical protein
MPLILLWWRVKYRALFFMRVSIIIIGFICHRGDEFRPDYKTIGDLRSPYSAVPWLMLTATCTEPMRAAILESLHLTDEHVEQVALLPDRYIFLFELVPFSWDYIALQFRVITWLSPIHCGQIRELRILSG